MIFIADIFLNNLLCYCTSFERAEIFFNNSYLNGFYNHVKEKNIKNFFDNSLPRGYNTKLKKDVKNYLDHNNLPNECVIHTKNIYPTQINLTKDTYSIAHDAFNYVVENYLDEIKEKVKLFITIFDTKEYLEKYMDDLKLTENQKNVLYNLKEETQDSDLGYYYDDVLDLYEYHKSILRLIESEDSSYGDKLNSIIDELFETKIYNYCKALGALYFYIKDINTNNKLIVFNIQNYGFSQQYVCYAIVFEVLKDILQVDDKVFDKNLLLSQIELKDCDSSEKVLLYILNQLIYVLPQSFGGLKDISVYFAENIKKLHKIKKEINEIKK